MATLVFGAAGTAIGTSLFAPAAGATGAALFGATLGATLTATSFAMAGALVDQMYIFPGLLPTASQEGPRIESIQAPSAYENSPLAITYGPSNRIGGTILWVPNTLIEEKHIEIIGGKGTDTELEIITYKYYAHIAVALCEGEITGISKIWANGELIYRKILQDITLTGATFSVTPSSQMPGFLPGFMRVESATLDITTLRAGALTSVAGFSNGWNNGNFLCVWAGQHESGVTFADFRN